MLGRRIGTGRRLSRAWRLMLLLALIGMALSSLGGAIAASQPDPPPITQEEAEQADQPVAATVAPAETQPANTGAATEPPVAATETVTATETAEATEEADGQQVNQPPVGRETAEAPFFLQLVKRVCPSKDGFIPESASYAELDDGCRLEVADPANFFFIVTDATGEQHVVNDVAAFFELPTGRTSAAEKHAGGYGDPTVWCSFGKGEPPRRMEVIERGVTLEPKLEMLVTCEFFNPELPKAPESSLLIHKRICAEGYDIGSEKADPIVDCKEPAVKVPFTLADDDPATPDQQQATGEVIESGVVFEGLAGGRYVVTETPPEGVTGAVVWTCEIDGSPIDGDQPPLSEGFTLELEISDDSDVVCFWFNLRGGDPGSGDDGSITVVKVACPAGYDATSEKADPTVDCTKPMDDVDFGLRPHDPDVGSQKGRTGDDRPGMLTFEGLPAGRYTIEERLPEGFAEAVVWACTDDPRQQRSFDGPLSTGTRLEVELAAGQDLWCLWLNVLDERPADDGNTFTLYKWECPARISGEHDVDWYVVNCTVPMPGVVFDLVTDSGTVSQATDASGRIVWAELPAGLIEPREVIPASFGDPVVYCQVGEASPLTAQPVKEGTIQVELSTDSLTCHWYNIPEPSEGPATTPTPVPTEDPMATETASEPGGENTLTIYKWECPDGADGGQEPIWYTQNCTIEMPGVSFNVRSDNGTSAADSQANGTVFDELPDGPLTVRELIPDGYGAPRVFCGPVDASTLTEIPVTDGVIQLDIGAGADVQCHWYNIPEPSGGAAPLPTESAFTIGPGTTEIPMPPDATVISIDTGEVATVISIDMGEGNTVTVRKWQCPEGSEYGQSQAWYIETCAEAMDGVEFRLVTSTGDQLALTEGGVIAWSDLPMGNVALRETIPDGYGDPVMYCQSNVFGTTVYNPLDDGVVGWGVPDDRAYTFDCDWYNIPLPGNPEPEPTMPMPWTPTPVPEEPSETSGDGSIAVVKVTCPAGFDVDTGDPMRACTKPIDGISFMVVADYGTSQRARTGADGRGRVAFDGLPAGSYEITEARQAGTASVVWACATTLRDLATADGPLAEGGSVTVELSAGEDVTCLWLNVPEEDVTTTGLATMSLHLTARACGPVPPDMQTIDAYRSSCPERAEVQFSVALWLVDGGVQNFQGQRVDEQGVVSLSDLTVSEPQIELRRFAGYTTPMVFCRTDGNWSAPALDVGEWAWILRLPTQEPGAAIACEWYIPVDPDPPIGVFAVRHFVCDADVVAPSEETCTWNRQQFVFRVQIEGAPAPTWLTYLLALPFHLTVPRDVQFVLIDANVSTAARSPMAYCGPWDGTAASPETNPNHGWLDASGESGILFAPMSEDESIRCDWYVFPAAGG